MKKYKRFLVLLFIFIMLAIFSNYYIKVFTDIEKIFSYDSDTGFFNISCYDRTIYITDNNYNITEISIDTKILKKQNIDLQRCFNILDKPYLCKKLMENKINSERAFIRYSDSFDEYYGIYMTPIWEADKFLFRENKYIVAKSTPSIYFEYINKKKDINEKYPESISSDKKDHLYFEVNALKSDFYRNQSGVYVSIADNVLNTLSTSFIDIEKKDLNKDFVLCSKNNVVSVSYIKMDSTYSYLSYNNGKDFDTEPIRNVFPQGKKILLEDNGLLYLIINSDNNAKLYISNNNGLTFNFVNNFKYEHEPIEYNVYGDYIGMIISDSKREWIKVFSLKKPESPVFHYGNIFPSSFSDIIFDKDMIIFQEQITDKKYNIYKKNFKSSLN